VEISSAADRAIAEKWDQYQRETDKYFDLLGHRPDGPQALPGD
jgi:hypothetical protein